MPTGGFKTYTAKGGGEDRVGKGLTYQGTSQHLIFYARDGVNSRRKNVSAGAKSQERRREERGTVTRSGYRGRETKLSGGAAGNGVRRREVLHV